MRDAVPEQPANVYVTVYVVVVPGDTVIAAVVAPPGAQEYVPPPNDGVAVKVAEAPAQIVDVAGLIVTVGTGFTVTVLVPVLEQPLSVYVTVYVVDVPGDTLIDCVDPPPGAQEYVPPPKDGVAVKVAEAPAQIAAGVFTDTVGTGFTVTCLLAVAVQPDNV